MNEDLQSETAQALVKRLQDLTEQMPALATLIADPDFKAASKQVTADLQQRMPDLIKRFQKSKAAKTKPFLLKAMSR